MRSVSFDLYSGLVPPQSVLAGYETRDLPPNMSVIRGYEAGISSFQPPNFFLNGGAGVHVDTWLSLNRWTNKQDQDVFGMLKTGDRGGANQAIMGLAIEVPVGALLYMNFWSHNQWYYEMDWHCGYVFYYD